MARDFQQHGYSFKHFVKTVMKSNAYQLSSCFDGEWRDAYTPYYARKYVRMLSAVELHDAVTAATGRTTAMATGSAAPATVMEMPDPKKAGAESVNFMRVFGQSNREVLPKKIPPSAMQAMFLMQSGLVANGVLAKDNSRVAQLLKSAASDRDLIEKIYLVTVSRKPTASETSVAEQALKSDRRRGAENLQWALINSLEFLFSY
jgi:hypothetical protein